MGPCQSPGAQGDLSPASCTVCPPGAPCCPSSWCGSLRRDGAGSLDQVVSLVSAWLATQQATVVEILTRRYRRDRNPNPNRAKPTVTEVLGVSPHAYFLTSPGACPQRHRVKAEDVPCWSVQPGHYRVWGQGGGWGHGGGVPWKCHSCRACPSTAQRPDQNAPPHRCFCALICGLVEVRSSVTSRVEGRCGCSQLSVW
ncbi:hypothetical protein DPEC_G00360690 [Dallia pectoralis]|uniref:Uncharacterized protein n=1 Tax=Dallia pectoralis TaxID=75939 RepID=A0ACC2F0V1_DALPE|nr:hypothetical protein DPEC_G00360690 [Dallia pectoralis]